MDYFALIVAFAEKYYKDSGVGTLVTLITNITHYSITFLIGWIILLVIWFGLGFNLGPGVGVIL